MITATSYIVFLEQLVTLLGVISLYNVGFTGKGNQNLYDDTSEHILKISPQV
jgi:hypothetical protein